MTFLSADKLQKISRVAGVYHPEARLKPEGGGVDADQVVSDRMKGAADDPSRVGAQPARRGARARSTISRAARLVKVSRRIRSAGTPWVISPQNTAAQRRGLPRPSAREDQERVT